MWDRLVHLDERNRDAGCPGDPDQLGQVVLVGAVGAVLVLDLHQDDAAVTVDLPRRDDRVDLLEVRGDLGEVRGVGAAQPHALRACEPGRQASVVPLGADVRPGADDGVQTFLGDDIEEAPQINIAVLTPLTFDRLVCIPRDVGLDGVESHQARLADAVAPQLRVYARVMHGAGDDAVRFAVEQEVVVADAKPGCRGGGHDVSVGKRFP